MRRAPTARRSLKENVVRMAAATISNDGKKIAMSESTTVISIEERNGERKRGRQAVDSRESRRSMFKGLRK